MKDNLTKLYNTLALIETKGNNTKIMAQCLVFIEQMVQELDVPTEDIKEA